MSSEWERVCVRERERQRERKSWTVWDWKNERLSLCVNDAEESVWLFKSVCVCVRERERERETEKEKEKEKSIFKSVLCTVIEKSKQEGKPN